MTRERLLLLHGSWAAASAPSAPGPGTRLADCEESCRQAVRLALKGRALAREEGQLRALVRDLGIMGARAHAILVQIKREETAGGANA